MRILMLGNSYIFTNDLPSILAEITGAEVVQNTRGGARLREQLNPETRLGAKALELLQNEKWDFVILQEMSNGQLHQKPVSLKMQKNSVRRSGRMEQSQFFMRPGHINVEERSWKLLEWIMMRCIRNCMKLIT